VAKSHRLLAVGNRKLGEGVGHFDLPPVISCPGRTSACLSACYARRGRFRFANVTARLAYCYEQSQRPGFPRKLTAEVRRRGVMHFRWFSSGDVYSAEFARKMLSVMRELPLVTFWLYTRSWRVDDILPALAEMALLPHCSVWFSVDRVSGVPAAVPPGVRLAYMQDRDGALPGVDLVFRTRRALSLPAVGLPMVCPADTPTGRAAETTCGACQHCFR
jgi:hypothetical protein